jgi:hypothetical protein
MRGFSVAGCSSCAARRRGTRTEAPRIAHDGVERRDHGVVGLVGLVIAPRRTIRAWRSARGQRTLYALGKSADEVLGSSVEELRGMLGLPPGGQADRPPRLHAGAPERV